LIPFVLPAGATLFSLQALAISDKLGAFFSGFGSDSFMGRFPGLPSSILIAVGVGFLPLVATWPPSLLPKQKVSFIG